jgi:4-cresol dehydrogenase (hydroxylating)
MDLLELLQKEFKSDEVVIYSQHQSTAQFGKTTFSKDINIDIAIQVKETLAIPKLLTLANKHKFYLYPVSTNNNWGYGSIQSIALDGPKVIVDLSQLKKIVPTNKKAGLITLQPGVTQQDLFDYLRDNEWPFMVPVTGAGPNCSILSNALERGYGITPRTDHFSSVNALKAYIPHPDLCHTLFESAVSGLDGSQEDFIDKSFKWGLGPYIDGLFTQSNFGVVTEITVRLAPKPQHFSAFYLQVFDPDKFSDAVALIEKTLLECEGIVGSINLMDRRRLVSMVSQNPNGKENHVVMSDEQVEAVAKDQRLPHWMIVGSMYGSKDVVCATQKQFKRHAKKVGQLTYSSSPLINIAKFIVRLPLPSFSAVSKLRDQLNTLDEGIDIMLGKPNQVALPLAYWRNPRVPADKNSTLLPDKDKCGLLWYAPLIKMHPDVLSAFVTFVRETTPKYGIEPLITFTNLKHDCIDSTVPLVFDLQNPSAVEAAHQCLQELFHEGCKRGYVPYRINTMQQASLPANDIFWRTTNVLKQAIDPNGILAPNRYNP